MGRVAEPTSRSGGVVELVLWTVVWLLVGWIVLNRTVAFRLLFPGAVLCGIGLAILGGVGRIYLPIALASSAEQFGALGITIAYVGWLFVIFSVVVIAVTIGRVLTMDYGVAVSHSQLRRRQPLGKDSFGDSATTGQGLPEVDAPLWTASSVGMLTRS